MIDAARAGTLKIEKLEAMTAVCSVGLDMIVVPGDTTAEVLSAVIADEAAIGMGNSKTTAVRLIPAIGKNAGEELNFGGLLGSGPIMPLNTASPAKMISRGGRIPAPLQRLKNANGQLGYDVIKRLNALGDEPVGADREEFDITDGKATEDYITALRPDAIVHCAAYTAVDKAEDDRDTCRKVNVDGTRNIALACEKIGAKLVYISSDYVFGGSGTQPLEIDAPKDPKNIYGITKLGGEEEAQKCQKHFIVRTSWVFGINGGNFVKTMLRLADSHEKLTVVDDQTGSPTYTPDLARLICDMIKTEKYGTYHASNEGYCTWAEFAKEIMRQAEKTTKIIPCTTAEYPAKAKRPENSRLSKKCLDDAGFDRLPPWQDALARFLKELDLA